MRNCAWLNIFISWCPVESRVKEEEDFSEYSSLLSQDQVASSQIVLRAATPKALCSCFSPLHGFICTKKKGIRNKPQKAQEITCGKCCLVPVKLCLSQDDDAMTPVSESASRSYNILQVLTISGSNSVLKASSNNLVEDLIGRAVTAENNWKLLI